MTPVSRRPLLAVALFSALAAVAQAHPGHDGHELTWDLQHLVDHPLATLLCAGVLVAGAWAAWRGGRYLQSLRASQVRRGK